MDELVSFWGLNNECHHGKGGDQNDKKDAYNRHGYTSQTCSNRSGESWIPEAFKRSMNKGRCPVARKRPSTRLFGPMPRRSNTKMSWSMTMSSPTPVTSDI